MSSSHAITPRRDLNFHFDEDMPRHWAGGDAFKTRLLDAFSLQVPIGERLAMRSVQAFQADLQSERLRADVAAFISQEGQHSMQHRRFNALLAQQGVNVDAFERLGVRQADLVYRAFPKAWLLALMAAVEHLNAVFGDALMRAPQRFEATDWRALALHVWHGAEEWEHRAVCFDVMQAGPKPWWLTRMLMFVLAAVLFPGQLVATQIYLLRVDGLSWRLIAQAFWRHRRWLWGRDGFFRQQTGAQWRYVWPSFHPQQATDSEAFTRWQQAMLATQDPVRAAQACTGSQGSH